jgi:PTH1 family peptidyl-tRNA hydrolase
MKRLIVFLGNHGPQYAFNRHNAGWLLSARLPFSDSLSWKKKFKGRIAEREGMRFLLPETFMNASGESAQAAASFYGAAPENILVVHDELELPLGTVSLKEGGGLGGHNGLRSMKASLGTDSFWRLRVGIGRPPGRAPGEGGPPGSGGDVYGWVLSDFSRAEEPLLDETLEKTAPLVLALFNEEPGALLPEWKKVKLLATENNGG